MVGSTPVENALEWSLCTAMVAQAVQGGWRLGDAGVRDENKERLEQQCRWQRTVFDIEFVS